MVVPVALRLIHHAPHPFCQPVRQLQPLRVLFAQGRGQKHVRGKEHLPGRGLYGLRVQARNLHPPPLPKLFDFLLFLLAYARPLGEKRLPQALDGLHAVLRLLLVRDPEGGALHGAGKGALRVFEGLDLFFDETEAFVVEACHLAPFGVVLHGLQVVKCHGVQGVCGACEGNQKGGVYVSWNGVVVPLQGAELAANVRLGDGGGVGRAHQVLHDGLEGFPRGVSLFHDGGILAELGGGAKGAQLLQVNEAKPCRLTISLQNR
jgi:hypothetical protein